jgi:hypothetical protein
MRRGHGCTRNYPRTGCLAWVEARRKPVSEGQETAANLRRLAALVGSYEVVNRARALRMGEVAACPYGSFNLGKFAANAAESRASSALRCCSAISSLPFCDSRRPNDVQRSCCTSPPWTARHWPPAPRRTISTAGDSSPSATRKIRSISAFSATAFPAIVSSRTCAAIWSKLHLWPKVRS